MMANGMLTKIRDFYVRKVYPKFWDKRGFTRIKIQLGKIVQRSAEQPNKGEINIWKDDWENLFILDACRLDLYREIEPEAEGRNSKGSSTAEFVEKNFSEGDFSDIVYVTGNPHFSGEMFEELTGRKPQQVFHETFHTYMEDWDKENGTVLPEPLIRDAKTARKLFPEKKVVVHFMQPHYPFVNNDVFDDAGISQDLDKLSEDVSNQVWMMLAKGELSKEQVWDAYRGNLEYVLDKVKVFAKTLEGETVITSDHGNSMGENSFYGHPRGVSTKELREVPYHKLNT